MTLDIETHPLADISKTCYNSDLTSKHDISSTLDTVNQGLAASIVVIELGFSDRIINIDGRNFELAIPKRLVQVMNSSSGLLRDATDLCRSGFQLIDMYWRVTILTRKILRVLFMNKGGQIAPIIKDHVQGSATFEAGKSLLNAPSIFFLSFTFPGENWNTGRGNATTQFIFFFEENQELQRLTQLQRDLEWKKCSKTNSISYWLKVSYFKDYTRGPGHLGTEGREGFNQNCCLNRPKNIIRRGKTFTDRYVIHVQAASNTCAF